jgi:hypothetical protein
MILHDTGIPAFSSIVIVIIRKSGTLKIKDTISIQSPTFPRKISGRASNQNRTMLQISVNNFKLALGCLKQALFFSGTVIGYKK